MKSSVFTNLVKGIQLKEVHLDYINRISDILMKDQLISFANTVCQQDLQELLQS
jgi:hypothetical protein